MTNPFSLSFGKEPLSMIQRENKVSEICDSFLSDNPEYNACMITGLRGSGKTVLMTSVAKEIQKDKAWIVADVSPERDIIQTLASELGSRVDIKKVIKDAKINISLPFIGIGVEPQPQVADTVVILDALLKDLTKRGKKLLITIDEVVSNKVIREFTSQFQIFIRKGYNIFLLMTGLYDNIYKLQNEKTLTFLYRAPKVTLEPLSETTIARKYQETLRVSPTDAKEMAKITKGYPYAFQVLGYLCFKRNKNYKDVLDELDQYLSEYVYEKIYSELSDIDRKIAYAMAKEEGTKVEDIRKNADLDSNIFNLYRNRLLKKGLVYSPQYGHLDFVLPRFDKFILSTIDESI